MKLSLNYEPPKRELGPVEWRFETDEFFGIWQLTPWVMVSWPTKDVLSEQHWNLGIGWIRWGFTISVGRWLRDVNEPSTISPTSKS